VSRGGAEGAEAGDNESEIRGSCHCGAVTIRVPHPPEWVGSCNCSLCTKTGWLVAYYPDDAVTVEGETVAYIWGDRMIGIHHCPTCGGGTHWKTLGEEQSRQSGTLMGTREEGGKMGVHARLLDGFDVTRIEVRLLDNRE